MPVCLWLGESFEDFADRLCIHVDQLEQRISAMELESLRNDQLEAEMKELRIGMVEIGVIKK